MATISSRFTRPFPWLACVTVLGLSLRAYHFLRDPSMWHDEAALVLNVLGKGFADLLGPLYFAEAAPPLFLYLEKTVTLVLGDSTYALRLIPFLASCASMVLMVPVARRLLRPEAVPWALLLFACSDRLLWHSCEAKPYAVDALAATALLAFFCTTRAWPLDWQLAIYSLLAPVWIFLVYPGCFLYGGLLVALLPGLWRLNRPVMWLGYGLLVLVVFAAFAILVQGPVHAQRAEAMDQCWTRCFPPWSRPCSMPLWTIASTFEVLDYCLRPVGGVLAGLALGGGVALWHRGMNSQVLLLAVPITLAIVASFLGAYPYGGSRVLVYAAPAVILLIGEGAVLARIWLRTRTRLGAAALTALLLVPLGVAAYRVAKPWARADCAGAAAYVMANRLPNDDVAANHWEYRYYFRNLGPAFHSLERVPRHGPERLWLVITAGTPMLRQATAQPFSAGEWRALERREFDRTTVLLLARRELPR